MTTYDVTLVTCDPLPEPDPDMEPLRDALVDIGLTTRVCAWNSSNVDWSRSSVTLIRSTWDYYHHRDSYLQWATHVSEVSTLYNPRTVVEWNSHKSYLLDLDADGLPVVPTILVRSGSDTELAEICTERRWQKVVVKPAVSAASFQTHVVDADHIDERLFAKLLQTRDMLVQPYLPEISSVGERSVIAIDGQISHCVGKSPRFHGEDEDISGPLDITDEQEALARRALGLVDTELLYARVDMVDAGERGPLITELELIEPSLFLEYAEPAAARRLASGLITRVRSARAAADTSSAGTSPVRN